MTSKTYGPYPESPLGSACGYCIHFATDPFVDRSAIDSESMIVAECRRLPPTKTDTHSLDIEDRLGAFPLVVSNSWCGEFVSIDQLRIPPFRSADKRALVQRRSRFDDCASNEIDATHQEFSRLIKLLAEQTKKGWTSSELTALAKEHSLLQSKLGDGTERSQSTRMGLLAGRYVGETFPLDGNAYAILTRSNDCRCTSYQVSTEQLH